MLRKLFLLPVVLLAPALAACGGPGKAITFRIDPRHGSGLDAVAVLAPASARTSRLTIELSDRPRPGTGVGLYSASCAAIPEGPGSAYAAFDGTKARLRVHAAATAVARGEHAVALKRNGIVLACGDVPPGPA